MTLMDVVDRFMASYITRTKQNSNPNKEDSLPDDVEKDSAFGKEGERFQPKVDGKDLTPIRCRMLALSCPGFVKGSVKKSQDTFRAGFEIGKDGKEMTEKEQKWINEFNKRNNILQLLSETKFNIHIYGTAIWYIRFDEEININKQPNHALPPPKNALPFKVKLLDPEKIVKYDYVGKNEKLGIKHLIYRKSNGSEFAIHPDRIIQFHEKKLPFSDFGISDVIILRHIISSIVDVDIAVGKVLKWFSHGVIEWIKDGAGREEMKKMKSKASEHPDIYIGNEKYHLNIHNPRAIDPEPFFDYLWMCIAATLVMPTHVLKGVEIGRVTGAEAGYSDYYRDISDLQNLIYAPRLIKLYQMIFNHYNDETKEYVFDYNIEWNPTYVSESAEAELDDKRSQAIERLTRSGIVDIPEARDMYNRGHIKLVVDKNMQQKENKKDKKDKNSDIQANLDSYKLNLYKEAVQKRKELEAKIKKFNNNPGDCSSGELEEIAQELRLKKADKDE